MMTANDKLREALEAGWKMAAKWACRDDLIADIGSPAFELDAEAHLKALAASKQEPQLLQKSFDELAAERRASKPEPQSQAGEPRIVGYVYSEHGIKTKNACIDGDIPNGTQLITLQSHREAMAAQHDIERQLSGQLEATAGAIAAKDAALDVALEALHGIDQQIDLSKYPSAPPDVTLLDELRDAITKIKEARG